MLRLNLDYNVNKLFIMNSRDEHIRDTLIKRNWVELDDKNSVFYHLKWVYVDMNKDYHQMNNNSNYLLL